MSLTTTQIADVQRTWAMCMPSADTMADVFYGRLFSLDPKFKTVFADDMREQKRMLLSTLTTLVGKLDDMPSLAPVAQQIGKRHSEYGVKVKDYATVGKALLDTLERGLVEAWTPPVKAAWTAVCVELSKTMIAAKR